MRLPFEQPFEVVAADLDHYVDQVFESLASDFLVMPKGAGFVEFPVFEGGYEALKQATGGFTKWEGEIVLRVVERTPISLVVLRTMLGFTPPEWAYETSVRTGVDVAQGYVRSLDRDVRLEPLKPLEISDLSKERLAALVETACAPARRRSSASSRGQDPSP